MKEVKPLLTDNDLKELEPIVKLIESTVASSIDQSTVLERIARSLWKISDSLEKIAEAQQQSANSLRGIEMHNT